MDGREGSGTISRLYQELTAGNRQAADRLWEQFFPRLLGLIKKTFGDRPCRLPDAEDIAQSVLASFCLRAERGDFGEDLERQNMWALLSVMAVRRVHKLYRREQTQKRGAGRVLAEADMPADAEHGFALDQIARSLSARELDLNCEELLAMLDDSLRQLVLLKLMQHTNREIADKLHWTERKVERKLQLVRLTWIDSCRA
jgi:DNA-directed RNA polymerase specialized sigma24 family protein